MPERGSPLSVSKHENGGVTDEQDRGSRADDRRGRRADAGQARPGSHPKRELSIERFARHREMTGDSDHQGPEKERPRRRHAHAYAAHVHAKPARQRDDGGEECEQHT